MEYCLNSFKTHGPGNHIIAWKWDTIFNKLAQKTPKLPRDFYFLKSVITTNLINSDLFGILLF